jgi:hypothetical protein
VLRCGHWLLLVLVLLSLASRSGTTRAEHVDVNFNPVPPGTAYTVELEKAAVGHEKQATFFMALKAVRAKLRAVSPPRPGTLRGNGGVATAREYRQLHQNRERKVYPGRRLHSKHVTLHDASSDAHEATRTATLGLIDERDEPLQQQVLSQKRLATYFGVVQLGQCVDASKTKTVACKGDQKERLTFKMLFDTGSCEFWVPGIGCTKDPKYADMCANHRTFDPEQSDSYKFRFGNAGPFQDDQKMCIQYLSGKIEGFMAKDYVCVGALCVAEQVFGMADTVDVPLLKEVVWDGIIGLAFPNSNLQEQGVVPLMDNMMQSSILTSNMFAYYIGMSEGAVTFGGVDKKYLADKNDDKFRFAVVTEKTYWTVEIVEILLQYGKGGKPQNTGLCAASESGERCKAIVDTGTYLIYGPQEQMTGDAPLSKLKVDACGDLDVSGGEKAGELPTVIFKLWAGEDEEPAKLALHPHDYVLEFTVPTEAADSFIEEGLSAAKAHMESGQAVDCVDPANRKDPSKCKQDCVIGIAPDDDTGWTFGQVFLRSFYTVFDRTEGEEKVGFLRNNPRVEVTGAKKPLMGSIESELRDTDNTLIAHDGKMEKILSPPHVSK